MPAHEYQPKHFYKMRATTCCCGENAFSVGKFIGPSGQIKYPWYCMACKRRSSISEPKHEHLIYTHVFDDSEINQCEVCGKQGAEWHHWAPRDLFKDECEKWPMGLLCQPCHAHWHQIVTPRTPHVIDP